MVAARRSTGGRGTEPGARALRLLARGERSEGALRVALSARGLSPEEVSAEVEVARRTGALDDARSLQARARALVEGAGHGWAGMHGRLVAAGYASSAVDAALQAAVAEAGWSELDAARALVARRGRGAARGTSERLRLARFLLGRGFPEELVEGLFGPS